MRHFEKEGYALDAVRSAAMRVALLLDEGYQTALQTGKAWWFVKNVVVFADVDWEPEDEDGYENDGEEDEGDEYVDGDQERVAMDTALANAPWKEPPSVKITGKVPAGSAAEALLSAHFYAAETKDGKSTVRRGRSHILSKQWTSMYDQNEALGQMWRRDWDEFAELFAVERRKALVRLGQSAGLQ